MPYLKHEKRNILFTSYYIILYKMFSENVGPIETTLKTPLHYSPEPADAL